MAKLENALFSDEVIDEMSGGLFSNSEETGPIKVLGITFSSEDERRQYFREELRKQLPALRLLDGFPLGSDDDIINLSDPPYYTACPNPWLSEIIQEWEASKKEIPNRIHEFSVKTPYSYGITQGKNSAIYNAHSYHTKVPHEVIMRYILHYTQPGDIVLDGFAGTGMTGVAAASCGKPGMSQVEIESDFKENGYSKPVWGKRHAICGDLSPLCYHISSNYNSSVNTLSLKKAVSEIVDKLNERFGHFYELKINNGPLETVAHINYFVWSEVVACKNCGHELNVHDLSYDYNSKILYDKLKCPYCGTEQKRVEADSIRETIYDDSVGETRQQLKYECCLLNYSIPKQGRGFSRSIPNTIYPEYIGTIPSYQFGEGDKFGDPKRVGANSVDQVYYKRTKYVLAYLHHIINNDYAPLSRPLMFIFTSMLPKLTRMNRYMPQHGSRALVGPMPNTLYIPPQGVENNPIDQFEYQASKVLKAFEVCAAGSSVQICSATNSSLPDCSVDYIFTDPPFGANIMYSELNTISESWLKVMTNNEKEAISNNSQRKGLPEYQDIMTACFKEYNRVLKEGSWMTVEFSNTSAAFWNCLQYSIKSAGFVISSITDLNKERGGLHAMLGPTAVKQDLAISCYKPSSIVNSIIESKPEDALWDMVADHLAHVAKHLQKDGKSLFIAERDARIIYDRVISYYVQNGYQIPIDSQRFQRELSERFIERDGMYFSAEDAAYYEEKKKTCTGIQTLALIITSEQDGIHWLRNELEHKEQKSQDLHPKWMAALSGSRRGDIIPDLKQVLEENFIKNEDDTWRVPNIQDDVDMELLRTRSLLKEFKLYAEQAAKPRAKLKEVRVEAVRAGFKQCYIDKDFQTIVTVGDKIPQNLLEEDEILLQFYDIAVNHI